MPYSIYARLQSEKHFFLLDVHDLRFENVRFEIELFVAAIPSIFHSRFQQQYKYDSYVQIKTVNDFPADMYGELDPIPNHVKIVYIRKPIDQQHFYENMSYRERQPTFKLYVPLFFQMLKKVGRVFESEEDEKLFHIKYQGALSTYQHQQLMIATAAATALDQPTISTHPVAASHRRFHPYSQHHHQQHQHQHISVKSKAIEQNKIMDPKYRCLHCGKVAEHLISHCPVKLADPESIPWSRRRPPTGIPRSLLRPAVTAEEKRRAYVTHAGEYVVMM